MSKKLKIKTINNNLPDAEPVTENFGVLIDDINPNIPNYNGTIWGIFGKGGSGKSSLFLSLFKSKKFLRGKFDEIHYIVRGASFNSVKKNPFYDHENVHHELTADLLHEIHDDALERREQCIENGTDFEYTCVIIDDFASELKNADIQHALKTIGNVSRHAQLYFIIISQTYIQIPADLRRILTHVTLFKPNVEEFELIRNEQLMMSKDKSTQIYNYCFDKLYNHLDINNEDSSLRKNFKLLEIDEN